MATSTPTGAMGKPQAATAEKGQSLLTAICEGSQFSNRVCPMVKVEYLRLSCNVPS